MQILSLILSYFYNISPSLYYFLLIFGAFNTIPTLIQCLTGSFRSLLSRRIKLTERYGDNTWALITGSSQGIGRQFALELAREGFNIILLARTHSKLTQVKEEILKINPKLSVNIIIADLITQGKKQQLKQILPELDNYNISIVVNNAGIDVLSNYLDLKVEKIIDLISINCFALTALNYKFINKFQKAMRQNDRKRAIINVASVAGQLPLPFHNVYSASKGYVNHLTKNLSIQYPQIDWLVLRPSQVSTAMTCYKKLDIFTVTARQSACSALNDLGKTLSTNGPISHKLQSFIYSLLPLELFNLGWTKIFAPQFMRQRVEYQKKLQENSKKQ